MNLDEYVAQAARVLEETARVCRGDIEAAATQVVEAIRRGGKLLLCGNGGSAADAQHFAAELINRLTKDFERPAIPAIALTTDASVLTAYANDYGFDGVFARQIEALGSAGDVIVLISTTGNSVNLVRAAQTSRKCGVISIALLGGDGGRLVDLVDKTIVVPSSDTQHVQEAHGVVVHLLCSLIERGLYT